MVRISQWALLLHTSASEEGWRDWHPLHGNPLACLGISVTLALEPAQRLTPGLSVSGSWLCPLVPLPGGEQSTPSFTMGAGPLLSMQTLSIPETPRNFPVSRGQAGPLHPINTASSFLQQHRGVCPTEPPSLLPCLERAALWGVCNIFF